MSPRETHTTLVAALLAVSAVAGVTALATVPAPAAADEHTVDTATDYTDEANFTVNLPFETDHYPGDVNAENGSIQYFAVGAQAMRDIDAEEGAFLHTVVISADWIDYSNCDVDNTAAFGFDRGNNNSGTRVDENLVSRRKDDDFRDDGLTVTFYTWDDFGGDPPYGAPEDAIVAEQGARSSGGACLTMTSEPGWYQVQGFVNGTEADNGPDQRPSGDANHAGILAKSNYIYVCECDSRAEAEEKLGPPPGPGDPTPTETPTGTDEPTPTTSADAGASTPTPTGPTTDARTGTPTDTDGGTGDGPTRTGPDGDGGGATTPTVDQAPGFGPIVAILALLAGALIARRHG